MLFEDLIGHENVKTYLRKALHNKTISNTLLFSGPAGIGKKLFAKEVAASIMYPERISFKDLKRIRSDAHPDLKIILPDSNFHSIASMREIIDESNLTPFEAEEKVFIIDFAEKMQLPAANVLLKTLEEPQEKSTIILITNKEREILPTVLSRAFKIKFNALKESEIATYLEHKLEKSESLAKRAALLSRGSLARAIEIVNGKDATSELLLKLVTKYSYLDLSEELSKLEELSFNEVESLFEYMRMWYRDLFIVKMGLNNKLYFADFKEKMKLSPKMPSLYKVNRALKKAVDGFERNIKLRTILENFFFEVDLLA